MKKSNRSIYLNTILLALGTICACALRTVAVLNDYDPKYGYFESGALISIAGWVVFSSCMLIALEAALNLKRRNLVPNFDAPINYIPAGLCAAAALFASRHLFSAYAEAKEQVDTPHIQNFITVISALLAVMTLVSFAAFIICKGRLSNERALFTLVISVFCLLFAAHIYFNRNFPLNAPSKIADLVAYIFASVFFLFEARISLGREKWRLYTLFGGIGALLCAYSSVPSLIAYFARNYILSTSIYESILTFTLFIFITARLILTNELRRDEPCELISALAPIAKQREERVNASDRNFDELMRVLQENASTTQKENDDEQISIRDILDGEKGGECENSASDENQEADR